MLHGAPFDDRITLRQAVTQMLASGGSLMANLQISKALAGNGSGISPFTLRSAWGAKVSMLFLFWSYQPASGTSWRRYTVLSFLGV